MQISIGVFFDGTGNNRNASPDAMTNVGRLSYHYSQSDTVKPIYVRGVGSEPVTEQDQQFAADTDDSVLLGGACGKGGKERIVYAMEQAAKHAGNDVTDIIWDVFGFSRGAALARHFCNEIRKGAFANTGLSGKSHKIRFLGIFDTVGSFGLPGDNNDLDYDFSVSNTHIQHVYHITSQDELRANFDLQSIKTTANEDLSVSAAQSKDVWLIEESQPGVHADIGGGYASTMEHHCACNQLALVYLAKMHEMAVNNGVPFAALDNALLPSGAKTDVPPTLIQRFDKLMQWYAQYPELSAKHQILRSLQRHAEVFKKSLDKQGSIAVSQVKRRRMLKQFKSRRVEPVEMLLVSEVFNGDFDLAEQFFSEYEAFRYDYIHCSHYPANRTPGMQVQTAGIDASQWPISELTDTQFSFGDNVQVRRDVFYQAG